MSPNVFVCVINLNIVLVLFHDLEQINPEISDGGGAECSLAQQNDFQNYGGIYNFFSQESDFLNAPVLQ